MKFPKRTIKENRYGNWNGYVSGKHFIMFGNDGERTAEGHAKHWLETETNADMFIEDLLKAEDAISGLSCVVDDEDVMDAVRARPGFNGKDMDHDLEERLQSLMRELSDTIDSL